MNKSLLGFAAVIVFAACAGAKAARAQEYVLDPAHSSANFKISHLGLSWVFGRFNELTGDFKIDPADATKSSFAMSIKAESLDTNNAMRDTHLRSPDFFNSKQFPTIGFKSTAVKAIKDGFEVTGDLTLHGVTKPVTFALLGGRTAEFPKGTQRTGYTTELSIKRTEFGMDKMIDAIPDDVHLTISFEGTKK
jgi:polyisoprenoid-binding protein YceI